MKQTLLKVLILLVSANQTYGGVALKKFKPGDYETDFDEGLGCDNVAYYEINKKTGKTFKIARGETINIGPTQDFKGYDFTTKDKKFLYEILYQGDSTLKVMHPKTYQIYSDEEVREY